MINSTNVARLIGTTVKDSDGDKIGKVGQIYVDPATGQPNWATVKTGLFGTSESFVPLDQADEADDEIRVPFTKDFVKDAPRVDAEGALEESEEGNLYAYYHDTTTGAPDDRTDAPAPSDNSVDAAGGDDTSGQTNDDAMTRSEERLRVGTERVEAGRARLRKFVVTEDQTVTVPVSREEVRVEHQPITEADAASATDGSGIGEEEQEVGLTQERPVVEKETVPVERVRLGTETVSEDQQVNEQVRKEKIEYEGDSTPRAGQ
ncbi:MAG: hypothetical protein QOH44_2136 [Actinomycetota bacterium]|jgi:uncharacterized protein (TIGR02271 family)|nr:hypothetical protein [Actinomycetota bacterium]